MGSRATDPSVSSMKSKCQFTDVDWPRYLRRVFSVYVVVFEYIKMKMNIFVRNCDLSYIFTLIYGNSSNLNQKKNLVRDLLMI